MRNQKGVTLVEILVTSGILVVLGGTLMLLLTQGVKTWRRGESRRKVYEEGQTLLRQIREDLQSAVCWTPDAGAASSSLFICDRDTQGRQRLLFIRTVSAEPQDLILGQGGTMVGGTAVFDLDNDAMESIEGRLRAPAGLMEIGYVMDPAGGSTLYRGVRSPPGGNESLFVGESTGNPDTLRKRFRPFSHEVLYLGLRFWTPWTTTWDSGYALQQTPSLRADGQPVPVGPALIWDSTRGLFPQEAEVEFPFWTAGSADNPADDIYPTKILLDLVIQETGPTAKLAILLGDLNSTTLEIPTEDAGDFPLDGGYVRIGTEWIRYDSIQKESFLVAPDGRGVRATIPTPHTDGDFIESGKTFTTIIHLPGGREDWSIVR